MKCDFYLELTPSNFDVYPQIMLLLHHFNRQNSGNKIAVAFPHMREGARRSVGGVVRFWNDDETLLHQLKGGLTALRAGRCSDVLARPEHVEEYVAYRHFKVPSRNTKGTAEQNQKSARKRMEKIERSVELPYIIISSGSTQQHFPLNIEKTVAPHSSFEGNIDSYGLSLGQPLHLPSWTPKNRDLL